jgi:enediyne polyketide synthase
VTSAPRIEWLASGKPVVAGSDGVGVSFAHDDWAALAVAGAGEQGCDIAPVEPRPRATWLGLLGAQHEALLDGLIEAGDDLDIAATRLWAAAEAARKAGTDPHDLTVERRADDAVLLRAGDARVLTFPLRLAAGPLRIVAVVVEPEPSAGAGDVPAERFGYDLSAYALAVRDDGPVRGLPVVTVRFPLTFRESANLSRTLFFSHVFMWMGKLRELAVQPVYAALARQFATGRWGMVTNYGETRYFGEARAEDVIEGRFWLGPASGALGSTQEFHYEWWRLPSGTGEPERFAWSRMGVTWVEILGHGVVEPRPLPDYYASLMDRVTPAATPETRALLEPHPAPDQIDLGGELWLAPPGPSGGLVLHEEAFDTSLEESNLVGNIYFANYYVWQGVARDRFFQALAPELYQGTGESGELRCLHHRTDHLREAMPFQRIAARMSLTAVHERGVHLRFDLFRLDGDRRDKLGAGVHTAGWFVPAGEGEPWKPALLPPALREPLLALCR